MNVHDPAALPPASVANALRGLAIDAVEHAGHGHPGAAMGMADIAAVLYARYLKFDAASPTWHDRDRLVLSNGHAAIFLYSLLVLTGTPGLGMADLKSFRSSGSLTPGHPEAGHTPGVEVTTGPLGQGLGMALGLALAERRMRDEFGPELCDHRTWAFCGDGCLMEGVGQEACSLAGHLGLGKLNILYDSNGITIDGSTRLTFTEDTAAKFRAMGWHVVKVNGHDLVDIDAALSAAAQETARPSLVVCSTTIGYGAPHKSGTAKVHGAPLGPEEAAATKKALGLPEAPFAVAPDSLQAWQEIGRRGKSAHAAWQRRCEAQAPGKLEEYRRRMAGQLPAGLDQEISAAKSRWYRAPQAVATRKASQMALDVLTQAVPDLIGGSADLSGSNLTQTPSAHPGFAADVSGRYVNYGVREFAMGAAMNGMARHGGLIPYGGTFLVFSDYMRNAIRLAALMKTRTLFVMTHDSIGLGEDGPTHQPVEHLASLRAMPGLQVFRPADVIETVEAYEVALNTSGPSLFALSRQATDQVRLADTRTNQTARGGYVIFEPDGRRDLTLLATGTEVALAVRAATRLDTLGVSAAVVSLPCWSLFDAQPQDYRRAVLGDAPRLAVEAASPFGWTRYVASEDNVLGVSGFGASASAAELYRLHGLTVDGIVGRGKACVAAADGPASQPPLSSKYTGPTEPEGTHA